MFLLRFISSWPKSWCFHVGRRWCNTLQDITSCVLLLCFDVIYSTAAYKREVLVWFRGQSIGRLLIEMQEGLVWLMSWCLAQSINGQDQFIPFWTPCSGEVNLVWSMKQHKTCFVWHNKNRSTTQFYDMPKEIILDVLFGYFNYFQLLKRVRNWPFTFK